MDAKKTVFVGLSGGVDSSVAALRLIEAGYNVVGVFIKVWQPEFIKCNWEAERLDAMRVAAKLQIPFLTCDAEAAYKDEVADYFISEYKAGRTPNPDVMCNKHVKFGAFLKFAQEQGADYIATGHYAQKTTTDGKHTLLRGVDTNKDQSYFLWTLTQEQLQQVLLPIGNSEKSVVRKEAEVAGLITAEKKDSQGICFLGHIDIPEFLANYVDLVPGEVRLESGELVGTHKGALVYTIGQRHGFTISTKSSAEAPHYVVERDIVKNTLTVSPNKPLITPSTKLLLSNTNYIAFTPTLGEVIEIQNRYRQVPIKAKVTSITDTTLTLIPETEGESASVGQSCVLYRGATCLGGGIIAAWKLV